jgi:hypothetical protein
LTVLDDAATNGLRGLQRPRILHLPSVLLPATSEDALYLCGEWGFGYDDWQEFTLGSSLGEGVDGRWAAKEIGLEVPRQNGKGEIVEGRECLGLFLLGERKLIHSAHEFATASEALDRMDDRIGQNPSLKRRVRTVKRSHGEEGVYLKDGRSLRYKTRTKGGGRGFGADLLVLDEAMFLAEAFLGALMPVISARPNPQMWYMGSPVDRLVMDHGIVFSRLRRRALAASGDRLAYFGWSPAFESPQEVSAEAAADPAVWAEANPALGIRIDPEHVAQELEAMDHRTFCVERLGVGDWPDPDQLVGQALDFDLWMACADAASAIESGPCFAFDVKPDRSWACIAAAGRRPDGVPHVEVGEHRAGTGWVVDRLKDLVAKHPDAVVRADMGGPAGALGPALEAAGVTILPVSVAEHARACGLLFDAVSDRTFRHPGSPELNQAVRGAVKRPLGDAWAWSRKSSAVDISPLVACTLALFGLVAGGGPSVYEDRGLTVIG